MLDVRVLSDRAIAVVEVLRRIAFIDQAAEIVTASRLHDGIDIAARAEARPERYRVLSQALLLAVGLVGDDGVDEYIRLEGSHALGLRIGDHHDLPLLQSLLRILDALGPIAFDALNLRLTAVHGIRERDLAPRRRRLLLFEDQNAESRAMKAVRNAAAQFAAAADNDQVFHRWNLLSLKSFLYYTIN